MANAESVLKNEILLDLGQLPDVYIQNQPTGTFRSMSDPKRLVKIGVPGQSDLLAIVAVKITPDMVGQTIGVAWLPEVKTAKGAQRDSQARWQAAVERRGARYDLVRSVADARLALDEIRGGKIGKV
jgi:hypothetical protein